MTREAYERLRKIAKELAESSPVDDWSRFETFIERDDGTQVIVVMEIKAMSE